MKLPLAALALTALPLVAFSKTQLTLNEQEYFSMPGLDVTAFADIYPDGHQTGVTVIQHGKRVAANGDLRLEASPGQWSPVPKSTNRDVDKAQQRISQALAYPDESKDRKGFNPIIYPDLELAYQVHVQPLDGSSFEVIVDLEKPLPAQWVGKVGFNFELFPGEYFGKSYAFSHDPEAKNIVQTGIFTQQANGPVTLVEGEVLAQPLGSGKTLLIAPEDNLKRMSITSNSGELTLWDGRTNHNNGWFIVRSKIAAGATKNAIRWTITPHADPSWRYTPVVQVSQVGYTPEQAKKIVIEQDKRDKKISKVKLYEMTSSGKKEVYSAKPKAWGKFLRYEYLTLDFTQIKKPGIYVAQYRDQSTHPFRIASDVFDRHVWQPTLEYFLPVQMCHMRVNEKYRVWHDLCHEDDALMSPINHNHFDGYIAGESTLTSFKPKDRVPHLNKGGWHDAGDYDLRVESQAGTIWLLATMIEEFNLQLDTTTIDQKNKLVEIHQPDGISDALQQVEHGLLSVLGGYKAMGRLYRGIIVPTNRQYVMLGDAASQTDGLPYNPELASNERKNDTSGAFDDRWVFTEENPNRVLDAIGAIAAGARAMKTHNPELAKLATEAALQLYKDNHKTADSAGAKTYALVELYLLTGKQKYLEQITAMQDAVLGDIANTGWRLARVRSAFNNKAFSKALDKAIAGHQKTVEAQAAETPYGVPYKPNIWGAGWGIQEFGVRQYFFHKGWPEYADANIYLNALNFVLGVHPGENTMSFASGVGSYSATVAYGVNRADWSYIPGGVISGTALIRPDLPELKVWPFFWQQTEYVMGGGASNFMFLALAAQQHLAEKK